LKWTTFRRRPVTATVLPLSNIPMRQASGSRVQEGLNDYRFKASLNVEHPAIGPEEATKSLGLEPASVRHDGQPRLRPDGSRLDGVVKGNHWAADLEIAAGQDIPPTGANSCRCTTTEQSFSHRPTSCPRSTSTASDRRRTRGHDNAARPPDSERLRADGRKTPLPEGMAADPASRFPGRGSRGTRERAAHEPLFRRAMGAELPLTGLFFRVCRPRGEGRRHRLQLLRLNRRRAGGRTGANCRFFEKVCFGQATNRGMRR
jgi:hypothetical protein